MKKRSSIREFKGNKISNGIEMIYGGNSRRSFMSSTMIRSLTPEGYSDDEPDSDSPNN